MRHEKYIIEARGKDGMLLPYEEEKPLRAAHPYLFSKREFTIDNLCHYASYGQGRNNPSGPMELPKFFEEIGLTYRLKTW